VSRDGRRRNTAKFPSCEICDATVWASRFRDNVICGRCERVFLERQERATQAGKDLRRTELRERGHEPEPLENSGDEVIRRLLRSLSEGPTAVAAERLAAALRRREGQKTKTGLSPGDDWEELDNVWPAARGDRLNLDTLWGAVGQGNMKEAISLLDEAWETEGLTDVMIVAVPDDMLGDAYRIWVR
jgi:hypothetical protein